MKTFRNFLLRFNVVATTLALGVSSALSSSRIQNPLDTSDSNNSFRRRSTSVDNFKNNKSSYRSPIIFSNLRQFNSKNKFKNEETSRLTNNIYDWVKCASEISSEFKNNFFQEDLVRKYFQKKGEIQRIDVSFVKDSYEKTLPEKEALERDPIFNGCMYLIDTNRSQHANDETASWSAIGACPEYYQQDPASRDDYDEHEILGNEIGYSDQFRVVGWLLSEALKLTKTLQELYGNEIFKNDTFSQQLTIKTVKYFLTTKLRDGKKINNFDTRRSIKGNIFIFSYMLNRLLFGKWIDVIASNEDCSILLNDQKAFKDEFLFERQLCRDAMSYINTAGITGIIDHIRFELTENSYSVNKTSSARFQNPKDDAVPSVDTILGDLNALYQDSHNTPRGWLDQGIAKDEHSKKSRNSLLSEQNEILEEYQHKQLTLEKLYAEKNNLKHFIPSLNLASMKVLDESGHVLNLLDLMASNISLKKEHPMKLFWKAIPDAMPLKNIDNSSIGRQPGDFYYTIQAKNNNLNISGPESFGLKRDVPVLKNELLLLILESGVIDDVDIVIEYFDGKNLFVESYPAQSLCKEVEDYDELSKAVSIMKEIYSHGYFTTLDDELSSKSERNSAEKWEFIKYWAGNIKKMCDSQFSFDENKYPLLKLDSFSKLIINEAKVNSILDIKDGHLLKNLLRKNGVMPDLKPSRDELFIGKNANRRYSNNIDIRYELLSKNILEKNEVMPDLKPSKYGLFMPKLDITNKEEFQINGKPIKKESPKLDVTKAEKGFVIPGTKNLKFEELRSSNQNQLSINNTKKKRENDKPVREFRIAKKSQFELKGNHVKKESPVKEQLVINKKDRVQIKGIKKESPLIVENGKFQIKGNPVRKFEKQFISDQNRLLIKKAKKKRENDKPVRDPVIVKTSELKINRDYEPKKKGARNYKNGDQLSNMVENPNSKITNDVLNNIPETKNPANENKGTNEKNDNATNSNNTGNNSELEKESKIEKNLTEKRGEKMENESFVKKEDLIIDSSVPLYSTNMVDSNNLNNASYPKVGKYPTIKRKKKIKNQDIDEDENKEQNAQSDPKLSNDGNNNATNEKIENEIEIKENKDENQNKLEEKKPKSELDNTDNNNEKKKRNKKKKARNLKELMSQGSKND